MPRAAKPYLDRFPLISTHDLASAREATARFVKLIPPRALLPMLGL
jgi:hypothetical protein